MRIIPFEEIVSSGGFEGFFSQTCVIQIFLITPSFKVQELKFTEKIDTLTNFQNSFLFQSTLFSFQPSHALVKLIVQLISTKRHQNFPLCN